MRDNHFRLSPVPRHLRLSANLPAAAWPGLAANLARDPTAQCIVRPCTAGAALRCAGAVILWHLVFGVGGGLAVAAAGEPITWALGVLFHALGVAEPYGLALWLYLGVAALAMTAHGILSLHQRRPTRPVPGHGARHLPALAERTGAGPLRLAWNPHGPWRLEGLARPLSVGGDHLESRDPETNARVWVPAAEPTAADLAALADSLYQAPPATLSAARLWAFYGPLVGWGALWLVGWSWATPWVLAHAPGELAGYAAYALAGSLWATAFHALYTVPLHRPLRAPRPAKPGH